MNARVFVVMADTVLRDVDGLLFLKSSMSLMSMHHVIDVIFEVIDGAYWIVFQ